MVVLNPNCSEAVWLVDVSKLSESEKQELIKNIEKLFKKEKLDEDYVDSVILFGREALRIGRQAPFHCPEKLTKLLRKYGIKSKEVVELEI